MIDGIRYSIVIPVYRNQASVVELVARLVAMAAGRSGRMEAVFVVDGSPDGSLEALRSALTERSLPAQLVSLSRNFGSFSAIRAGLALARGDYLAVMAADLQEPPEVVDEFFASLERGECDIALGQRRSCRPRRGLDELTLLLVGIRHTVNWEIPPGGVDIFGCTAEVAARLSTLVEQQTSLIGLLYWVGYRRKYFPYVRQARRHGKSGWTLARKFRYLFDSIYAFTDLPIIALQVVGLAGVVGSSGLASSCSSHGSWATFASPATRR